MSGVSDATDGPRARKTSIALVVVASLLLFLGGFAVWANRQLLNTDDWVETSTELLEDDEIRAQVQAFLVDSLFSAVDVEGELATALPPRLQPLAGPAAGGLRELANRLAERALESAKVQQLWADANRAAHEQLIVVIEGGDGALSAQGGQVTLDLEQIVTDVGSRLGIDLGGKLPESVGEIEIVESDELAAAQDAADLLTKLAIALILAALLVYALAIWLARGRRRETVRAIGFAWIVVGVATFAARRLVGDMLVDQLAATAAVEPAVHNTYSIGTSLLAASAGALVGYGVVTVLGASMAGPSAPARSVRRELAPLFASRASAYALLLVVVLLVFFVWAPTEGTQRLLPSLVLLVLMVAGFEALRQKAVADFPEETWASAGSRWRGRLSGLAGGLRSRRSGPADPHEERLRQLERLAELRAQGILDDDELAREKAKLSG